MTISILQIIIFISYVTFVINKFGILPSISESWYRLRDLGGVWYSLFTWFCFGLGFLMFFQTNGNTPLFFLSGAGLSLVGTATMFKEINDKLQGKLHTIGAVIGILGSLIGIGVERDNWIPLFIFVSVAILLSLSVKKNRTWWIEIVAFATVGLGLLLTA